MRDLEDLHDRFHDLLERPFVRPLVTMVLALALGLIFLARMAIYSSVKLEVGRLGLMAPGVFGSILLACYLTGIELDFSRESRDGGGDGSDGGCGGDGGCGD